MFEYNCYNENGSKITTFTQWDLNQSIYIKNTGLVSPPSVHFTNDNMKESVVVTSTIEDDVVIVNVPNFILQQAIPVYIYLYEYDDVDSGKSLIQLRIPVAARQKPSNYKYVENIESYSLAGLKADITIEIKKEVNSETIKTFILNNIPTDIMNSLSSDGCIATTEEVLKFLN